MTRATSPIGRSDSAVPRRHINSSRHFNSSSVHTRHRRPGSRKVALPGSWLKGAMCVHRHESVDWHRRTDWLGRPSVDHGGMQIDVGTWGRLAPAELPAEPGRRLTAPAADRRLPDLARKRPPVRRSPVVLLGGGMRVAVTRRTVVQAAVRAGAPRSARVGTPRRARALYIPVPCCSACRNQDGYWLVTRHACAEVGGSAFAGLLARVQRARVSVRSQRLRV